MLKAILIKIGKETGLSSLSKSELVSECLKHFASEEQVAEHLRVHEITRENCKQIYVQRQQLNNDAKQC
jgi:hypothetical protein